MMGFASVFFSILAVICAFLTTFLFGTVGAIIAIVLGVIAVILGIAKRKADGKGGIAAIVIGVLAAFMALGLNAACSEIFTELHQKAVEYKPDGLWAQVSEKTDSGIMGIIRKLPKDESSLNALLEEMNELKDKK